MINTLSQISENKIPLIVIRQYFISVILIFSIIYLLITKSNVLFQSKEIITLLTNDKINKPLTDTRQYEIIKLKNDLMITLISDVNSSLSGFSMTTMLGAINKKIKYPGLSRLLQKKFVSDKLLDIIEDNIGKYRFETDEETSNYYFDIENKGFESAIMEFSNMLNSKPLFYEGDPKNLINDLRDIYEKENEDINQDILIDYIASSNSNNYDKYFQNGHNRTFSDYHTIESNLEELFNIYYSPQNIKIALISNYSINDLKQICHKYFNKLKIKDNSEIDEAYQNKISELKLTKFIWTKPNFFSEDRYLKLVLFSKDYQFKGLTPLSFFLYLLEGQRSNSVFYYLGRPNKKYIENLSMTIKKSLKYGNKIVITIKLSNKGCEKIIEIIKIIFGIIQSFKYNKNKVNIYNELQTIYNKKYLFMTIDKYSSYLKELTFNMINLPINETGYNSNYLSKLLLMNYELEPYNEDKLNRYLDDLTIDNSIIFFQSTNIAKRKDIIKAMFDKESYNELMKSADISYNFGKFYIKGSIKPELFKDQISDFAKNYFGKDQNPYLTKLSTLNQMKKEGDIQQVLNEKYLQFWIKKDTTFQVKRIHSYFHFLFPDSRKANELKSAMYLNFYKYINYLLLSHFEEAKLSGNDVEVSLDENGINLKIAAYQDVYLTIISKIFTLIFEIKFDSEQELDFEIDESRNLEEKTLNYLGRVIKPEVNLQSEETVIYTLNDFQEFINYNLHNSYIESLLYGDLDDNIILQVQNILNKVKCSSESNEIQKRFPSTNTFNDVLSYLSSNYEITGGSLFIYKIKKNFDKDEEIFYILFYQIGKRDTQLDIFTSLVAFMYNSQNYKGKMEKVYKDNMIYLRIILNSYTWTPSSLAESLEIQIESFLNHLHNMPPNKFENSLNYVKREFTKKDTRLRHKAIKYWYEIYERTFDFQRYNNIQQFFVNAQSSMLYNEFIMFCQDKLWKNVRQIEFWMYFDGFDGDIKEDFKRKNQYKTKVVNYSFKSIY